MIHFLISFSKKLKKGSSSTSSPNPNITLFDVDGSQEVKEAFELFAGIPKTNFFQKGSGQVEATLERGEVFLALRALGIEVHTDSIPNLIAEVAPEHTQAITLSQFTKIVAKQYVIFFFFHILKKKKKKTIENKKIIKPTSIKKSKKKIKEKN